MKNIFKIAALSFLILFFQLTLQAQVNLQKEINDQVWKPFIDGFSNNNELLFKSVHSRDVIRVMQDDSLIWSYGQYFPEQKGATLDNRSNHKKTIELRFIQRIAGNDKAFEVGYYNTRSIDADGKQRSIYGKFHVIHRKENGVWKILVDADSGKEATEEEFKKAAAME